jgi:hypothetical protein
MNKVIDLVVTLSTAYTTDVANINSMLKDSICFYVFGQQDARTLHLGNSNMLRPLQKPEY